MFKRVMQKNLQLLGLLSSWFAVVTQFIIIEKTCECTYIEAILRFLGYFTLTTNLIVAIYFSVVLVPNKSILYNFFTRISVTTAIAVYITVVAVLYNILLRFTWHPEGLQKIVDEFLHTVVPIIFLIHWLLSVKNESLEYNKVWSWLIYPAVYLFFISIRAVFWGYYPYYFVDIKELGIQQVVINIVSMTLTIVGFSLLFIWVAKILYKNSKAGNSNNI